MLLPLTSLFERTAVISLPGRTDRRTRLLDHAAGCGLDPASLQFFDAVEGSRLQPPEEWKAGHGAWGCLQSHLAVLRRALEDGVESVLIMEDDVCFHPWAGRLLPSFVSALPREWGQFYLGGQHLRPPRPCRIPFFVEPGNVNRTHAYAVSRAVMPAVIAWLERTEDYFRPNWHVDHQLGAAHEARLWPVLACSWWLAGQSPSRSDVSGRENLSYWWHPHRWALYLPLAVVPAGCVLSRDEEEGLHFLSGEATLPALHRQAQAALDHGGLPALRGTPAEFAALQKLWPAGLLPWEPETAAAWRAYPFNGLFPHPACPPSAAFPLPN